LDDGIDISVWTAARLRVGKLFGGTGLSVSRSISKLTMGDCGLLQDQGHGFTFAFLFLRVPVFTAVWLLALVPAGFDGAPMTTNTKG